MDAAAIDALRQNKVHLNAENIGFVDSILRQLDNGKVLSAKQWKWLNIMAQRAAQRAEGVPDFTKAISLGEFKKVLAMFATAKAHGLKYPKIRLAVPVADGVQLIALALAGEKHPGCINITDGRPYQQNTWFGRITPEGVWDASTKAAAQHSTFMAKLTVFLAQLAQNPAKVIAEYGKLNGHCSLCGIELTDARSKSAGYGPVCAKKWHLPWGEVSATFKEVA